MRAFPAAQVLLALTGAALALGCTDTKTVFVERPFFDEPPAEASGFIGYGTEDAQLANFTVCGNCHIGSQSQWKTTAHSHAWETLEQSGTSQEDCEGCHTVNERGNSAEGPVGWEATADMRYVDVQCESCHGPAQGHVSNPEGSQPLASIKVGDDLTSGCGECHSGSHYPFLDEWAQSRHGYAGNQGVRDRGGSCVSCHEARGAMVALGENADYIEKDGSENLPIVCAVCHDPHSGENEHQLRYPIDVANVDQNLCMKCHQRRAVPDENNPQRGPHSPQGPLLLGEDVGWIPPNFDTNIVRGTHGSAQNRELCATCHVNAFEVTDPITGDFVFSATGHLFQPIPCLDSQGIPTTGDCAVTQRTFASCTNGCHADETAARTVYLSSKQSLANLVSQIDAQLQQVPSSEFDRDDGVLTVAEGALFNQKLGEIESSAIHNPFLTEALILGSMQAVQDQYGIAPSMTPAQRAARLAEITNR